MDYGSPYGPGAPPSIAEEDPIGALLYQKSKKREEEMAQQAEGRKSADMQRQAQDANRARQELESMHSGRAIAPPSIPAAQAAGQKKELSGSKDVDATPSNNIDAKTSDGHGPQISFAQGTNFGSAADNLARLSGGDFDYTAKLNGPQHVDLNALTQGSLQQNDSFQQDQAKRQQLQLGMQNAPQAAEAQAAKFGAETAESQARTEEPFIEQYIKNRGALDIANAEGGSKIIAARQPGLVNRESEQMRIQQFAQAKDQAFRELSKDPRFMKAWNSPDPVTKKQAQDYLDQKTQEITEPIEKGMTKFTQRDQGFAVN